MKKLIILTLIMFSLFSSQVLACGEDTTKTTAKIDYVYYDSDSHVYYANTLPDDAGGHWVIELDSDNVTVNDNAASLTERFKAMYIDIVYVGSLDNDDIEIVDSVIYDPE